MQIQGSRLNLVNHGLGTRSQPKATIHLEVPAITRRVLEDPKPKPIGFYSGAPQSQSVGLTWLSGLNVDGPYLLVRASFM